MIEQLKPLEITGIVLAILLLLYILFAQTWIDLADAGIGIPVDEQANMFHKFSRASNANESTVHGTGLGLYIAKEIVRAHNGWIHVSSPGVGKGTTFTLELPLAPKGGVV